MISNLREIFQFWALVSALVLRHLSTRYRGSVLGYLWSLLNPLCLMLVYTLVFHYLVDSRFAQVNNYTIFLFCGLLPWIWTSSALVEGTSALAGSGHLITKSMFPPQVLALVPVLTSFVNFLLALPVLWIFMLLAGMPLRLSMALLPLLWLLHVALLYGAVLALSAWNVIYRDVQHLVANAISLVFFLCPIIYPLTAVPERFRDLYFINPFALTVVMYHELLLEGVFSSLLSWTALGGWAIISLTLGSFIFERYREVIPEML